MNHSENLRFAARGAIQRFRARAAPWKATQGQRDILTYSFGNLLAPIVGLVSGFVAAWFLAPEELGVVQSVMLIPAYLSFLHFGVFNGLSRNIAYSLGKNDISKVQRMVDASWGVAKLTGAVGGATGAAILIYFWWAGDSSLHLWAGGAVLITLLFTPITAHVDIVFRSSQSFGMLGRILVGFNSLALLANFLPGMLGAVGLALRHAVVAISAAVMRIPWDPIPSKGSMSWAEVTQLGRTGFPLLFIGVLYLFLEITDRSVVAVFLGAEAVGHFALAGLLVMGIQAVPATLSLILYPKAAHEFGRTGSASALRRFFWISLICNAVAVIPLALICYALVGPITMRWLPQYTEGIPAAQIACLSSLAFIGLGPGNVIAVLQRNKPYIYAIAAALTFAWLLGAFLATGGYGIEGAAWGRFGATWMLNIFTIVFSYIITSGEVPAESSQTC
jgi:O-antigen/teichoic acid export membrane protein